MKTSNWLFLLGLSGCLMACPSASTMGVARTAPAGKLQVMVNPIGGVALANSPVPFSYVPQAELGIRYSVIDQVEVGVKAWLLGGAVDTKIALIRPESEANGFNLSVAPSVSFFGAGIGEFGAGFFTGSLPVMMGFRFAHHELTLTPKLTYAGVYVGPASGSLWMGGGSIGFAPRLAPGFRLIPELTVLTPLQAQAQIKGVGGYESGSLFGSGLFVQA